ncbi:MAG: 50S ribosomal protein L6 [Planctomycetes bacterium]|jgi:large subunit ribosomal protein L6|nr:50S ribosomal protein L6 [Planctomycetota bacterium]
MSRIGKLPIPVPSGVSVEEKSRSVTVKGPKGTLSLNLRPEIDIAIDGSVVTVTPNGSGAARQARAFHGLTRALLANMVQGVHKGYEKQLDIIGIGWNAQGQGKKLTLNIGFCHPVIFDIPEGVEVETPKPVNIVIRGADKYAVGQFAATVRAVRPPEPYKGKGIRYRGEYVRRKQGKSFGS